MKNLLLLLVVIPTLLVGCGKNDDSTPPGTIEFKEGTNTNPEISASETSLTFGFTASDNWTATVSKTKASDVPWITLDKNSGDAGKAQIVAITDVNNTPNDRKATIYIYINGKVVNTINIIQKAAFSNEILYGTWVAINDELTDGGVGFNKYNFDNYRFVITKDKMGMWGDYAIKNNTNIKYTYDIASETLTMTDYNKTYGLSLYVGEEGKQYMRFTWKDEMKYCYNPSLPTKKLEEMNGSTILRKE